MRPRLPPSPDPQVNRQRDYARRSLLRRKGGGDQFPTPEELERRREAWPDSRLAACVLALLTPDLLNELERNMITRHGTR